MFAHQMNERFNHDHIDPFIFFILPNLIKTFMSYLQLVTNQIVVLCFLSLTFLVVCWISKWILLLWL